MDACICFYMSIHILRLPAQSWGQIFITELQWFLVGPDLRQLVRMLLKLMPNSEEHLPEAARRGGGNRMVRPHIEAYLENTLGEAPRLDSNASWKVYLAGLFSWVLDRPVSADEAARCLDRSPGTSWVARWPELFMLGISRDCFAELPLTKPGVQAAQKQLPKAEMQKCEMSVKTQADCQQPSLARAKLSRKHETTEPADMDNGKLYSWYNLKLAIRDTKRIDGSPGLEPSPRERKLLKAMKEEVLVEIQQLAGTGTFSI